MKYQFKIYIFHVYVLNIFYTTVHSNDIKIIEINFTKYTISTKYNLKNINCYLMKIFKMRNKLQSSAQQADNTYIVSTHSYVFLKSP